LKGLPVTPFGHLNPGRNGSHVDRRDVYFYDFYDGKPHGKTELATELYLRLSHDKKDKRNNRHKEEKPWVKHDHLRVRTWKEDSVSKQLEYVGVATPEKPLIFTTATTPCRYYFSVELVRCKQDTFDCVGRYTFGLSRRAVRSPPPKPTRTRPLIEESEEDDDSDFDSDDDVDVEEAKQWLKAHEDIMDL